MSGLIDSQSASAPILDEVKPDIERREVPSQTFAQLGVSEGIVEALKTRGIETAFPIQALTLPVALRRNDIIGQAKTGTGKTFGFAIPALESVVGPKDPGFNELLDPGQPQAVIVVPTRELAKQVSQDCKLIAANSSARVTEIYGGIAFEPQIAALERGTEIIVGTPGRMIDLMKRKVLKLSQVKTLVLDEADEMLNMGFLPDVETLLSRMPANRHTMLFSATMPGPVVALARRYMTQPTHIRAQDPNDQGATVNTVKQFVYRTHALNKVEVVSRILQADSCELCIIFARTKRTAARLADDLIERGFAAASLHGDLGQGAREQALRAFRSGKINILVATDVAARGLDVDNVSHVINYQCPEDEKIYIHRIGRTGRAGESGTAITFVDWDDVPRWGLISKALNLSASDPIETYHTSAHLYTDLGIPTDITGNLPRSQRTRAGLAAEEIEDLGGSNNKRRLGKTSSKRSERVRTRKNRSRNNDAAHETIDSKDEPGQQRKTRTRRRNNRSRSRRGEPQE